MDQQHIRPRASAPATAVLRRRGFLLEGTTLAWNVVGIVVLARLAVATTSVAVTGFGLDSLIEIGASLVVIWELRGTGEERRRRALRLIGIAFIALAVYLALQSTAELLLQHHPVRTSGAIAWTAAVMFALARGKTVTGRALGDPVLQAEGRVTVVDGLLAVAVLVGLTLDAALGWWWADPVSGFVIVYYAAREAIHLLRS